jgi:hypothetical protein
MWPAAALVDKSAVDLDDQMAVEEGREELWFEWPSGLCEYVDWENVVCYLISLEGQGRWWVGRCFWCMVCHRIRWLPAHTHTHTLTTYGLLEACWSRPTAPLCSLLAP